MSVALSARSGRLRSPEPSERGTCCVSGVWIVSTCIESKGWEEQMSTEHVQADAENGEVRYSHDASMCGERRC